VATTARHANNSTNFIFGASRALSAKEVSRIKAGNVE
jgi:hypothetical protein